MRPQLTAVRRTNRVIALRAVRRTNRVSALSAVYALRSRLSALSAVYASGEAPARCSFERAVRIIVGVTGHASSSQEFHSGLDGWSTDPIVVDADVLPMHSEAKDDKFDFQCAPRCRALNSFEQF